MTPKMTVKVTPKKAKNNTQGKGNDTKKQRMTPRIDE